MPVLGRQGCQASRVSIAWQTKPEMPPSQQQSRINLQDLKAQMVKRIGPEKASQYFTYFKGYINLRFNKPELDKLVVRTIGKENIGLHNQIIRAVLSNAIKSEAPPPSLLVQDTSKPVKGIRRKPLLQFTPSDDPASRAPASPGVATTSIWSNGNSFAVSPKKEMSGVCDRKGNKDKPSPLGFLGGDKDGKSGGVDLHRPSQEVQGAAELSEADLNGGSIRLGKRPRIIVESSSPDVNISKVKSDLCSSSGAEELDSEEARHHRYWDSKFIRAPLGVPFCPGSIGSATKAPYTGLTGSFSQFLLVKGAEEEFLDSDDLPDAETLQRRMEHIAASEGLEGVNKDCVEVLNQGLDTFLRRLIEACVDLVRSRSALQQGSQAHRQDSGPHASFSSSKNQSHLSGSEVSEDSNGVWISNSFQAPQGSGTRGESLRREGEMAHPGVSLLDFKAAMELNPQQLGEDWPLQLEKILFRSFE